MTVDEAIASLSAAGSDKTRQTYARHGVKREMYGVSYADLEKLRKKIKVDHQLATQLWNTGNHDARVLATMIADPSQVTARSLRPWIKQVDHSLISSALANLAAKSPAARECFEEWSAHTNDHISSTAWVLLSKIAQSDATIPDNYFAKLITTIQADIHNQQNETKYAMNGALIAIGLRNKALQKRALAAAARIGKVEVDQGDTACKTPDATAYIKKAAAPRE